MLHLITIRRYAQSNVLQTAAVALTVAAILFAIGFPIYNQDSTRYLAAAAELKLSAFSPGALPILLRPFYLLIGPWAFMLLNGVLLVWSAVTFSRVYFGRVRAIPIIVAILLSGAATMSAAIMMDIQTSFAVLALLVLARERSYAAWTVLVVGLISHGSAILILPAVALIVALVFRSWRPVAATGLALFAWFALANLSTYIAAGTFRATQGNSLLFVASRMMMDVPESVRSYAAAYPSSAIAANLPAFEPLFRSRHTGRRVSLLWGEEAAYQVIGYERVRAEAPAYIRHSLETYPWENLRAVVLNGPRLIHGIGPWTASGGLDRPKDVVVRQVEQFHPQYRPAMRRGLQYREKLDLTYNGTALYLSFLCSTAWLVFLILVSRPARQALGRDLCFAVPASVLGYYVVNAYVIGNLSGVHTPRQQVRMMYVPILFMCLSAAPVAAAIWAEARQRVRRRARLPGA